MQVPWEKTLSYILCTKDRIDKESKLNKYVLNEWKHISGLFFLSSFIKFCIS